MVAFLVFLTAARQTHSIALQDLDLSHIQQGWGQARRNKSVTMTPLSIGGKPFESGIGTHALSKFKIQLFAGATRFHAFCGVDDNAHSGEAAVVFRVIGDGKELWHSSQLTWQSPAVEADVNLVGVRLLNLEVDPGKQGIDFDHADWASPKIEYRGPKPVAFVPPVERPIILTPPPPHTPRINGPTVYGVRPGSPFLYLVPATGDLPLRYGAKGLPAGLTLDPSKGLITGVLRTKGIYPVQLTVANRRGEAKKRFRIVCGDKIALTPQMGWNSWYVWLDHVSDKILRNSADAMVKTGLSRHGWQYVDIDDCWARVPGSKDPITGGPTRTSDGTILPNAKFPDMRALTEYIHAKGLKAGIYTSPGPTTCGGYEGAFGHEALDAKTFAQWGFDLLKYDWCSYRAESTGLDGFEKPYRLMGALLRQQPRDIVFNLCQYGMADVWQWGAEVGGNSWRTAGDLGSGFTLFQDSFDLYAKRGLDKYAAPGSFNDPDYLLLGEIAGPNGSLRHTPFTPNEQYTQVSMWCLVAAPLILSGDITTLDAFTLRLLTNDEILAVDQDALVRAAHRVRKEGETEVWARPLEDGAIAVGLFNTGDEATNARVAWHDLNIQGAREVRDLWRQKNLGVFKGSFGAQVPRHGVVMLKLYVPAR